MYSWRIGRTGCLLGWSSHYPLWQPPALTIHKRSGNRPEAMDLTERRGRRFRRRRDGVAGMWINCEGQE